MKRRTAASSPRWPSSCGAIVVERLGPPLDEPIFDELAIIGVGLIGSSVARAAGGEKRRDASCSLIVR